MSEKLGTVAYADCFSGISGDMFLASLLDAGLPEKLLREELAKIDLADFQLTIKPTADQGSIKAVRVSITTSANKQPLRNWPTIQKLLKECGLNPVVQDLSETIFTLLAKAEAKVHGTSLEKIHFHEVGGVDSIIDIVGAAIGLEYFKVSEFTASPLPMPRGLITCDHGTIPLPAPAVCQLLRGVPVYGLNLQQELVTPTGAAILKGAKATFGPMPAMIIKTIGYGAGSLQRKDKVPNLLRLIIGSKTVQQEEQEVTVIESNIDDWSPESFPFLCETLLEMGALDVNLTPIQMKKGRPGFCIQIIAPPYISFELGQTLLGETSAIGLRYRHEKRMTLPRQIGTIPTKWGSLQVKRVETPGRPSISAEYEDCRRIALEQGVTIREVYKEASRYQIEDFKPREND